MLPAFDRRCGKVQTSVSFGWKRFYVVFDTNIRENRVVRGQQVGETAAALRLGEVGKDCRIGNNVVIKGGDHLPDIDTPEFCIRVGVVVVRKGAVIQEGTRVM